MKFVTVEVQNEWLKAGSRLKRLMTAVDAYSQWHFGIEINVTDVFRLPPPSSPHNDGRACDLRSIGAYSESQRAELRDWTNLSFPYGPGSDLYGTCKYERKGTANSNGSVATGDHLHFQVRPI